MTSKFEELVDAVMASLESLTESRTLTVQGRTTFSKANAALAEIARGSNNYKLTVASPRNDAAYNENWTVPATVARLAQSLPVWRKRHKTRALAFAEEDGVEVDFISGEDFSARNGLRPEYATRIVVTDHAEGHLAARMRQPRGPRKVTMVINKDPCGGPLGCDATLPKIIPRESTVTIYVREADVVRFWGTYRGTGEGIR